MAELNIGQAAKPRYGASTVYDLSYELDITPTIGNVPKPIYSASVNLLNSPTMVLAGSSTISTGTFYTDWTTATASFEISDWSNPRSAWYVRCNGIPYMIANYGFLPSTYGAAYEVVSINDMTIDGDYRGTTLYTLSGGTYIEDGCAIALAYRGSRASINYDVTLRRKSDGDIITVTGTSASYTVSGSPYSTQMALYQPATVFTSRGDMKGQIIMTETPAN